MTKVLQPLGVIWVMGAAAAALKKIGTMEFAPSGEEKDEVKKDPRKRNSLAFNIQQFVTFPEDDLNILAVRLAKEIAAGNGVKKEKVTKFSRMADAVLRGDFREIKTQTVNFPTINRRYGDHHNNSTMLHFICQEGYPEMLEFLTNPKNHAEADDIELEVDAPNNKNRSPLHLCFTPPHATYLGLRYGLDANGNPINEQPMGGQWLRPGGPQEREACVKHLIKQKCNVNLKDYHGFTALHFAAMLGWTAVCKMLLEANADLNAVTMTGRTPLMYACEYLHDDTILLLAKWPRSELNVLDADGQTALLIAMEHGEEGLYVVETLMQAGADVNQMNHKKKTPLYIACENQNIPQILLLFKFKCHRLNAAFELLKGEAALFIQQHLLNEEKEAAEALAKVEKERERLAKQGIVVDTASAGYKNKSSFGQWVDYIDKRDGGVFYYNKVSRESQKDKPRDFKPDKKRLIKEASFGFAFYH